MLHRLSALVLLLLVASTMGCSLPRTSKTTVKNRQGANGPRVLCFVAHPDDETAFAATIYKISTFLNGACDIVVLTNGEGGFKYSTLGERIYGLELTDERIGRRALPSIRRREMLEACRVLEVRNVYFLNETDHRYTRDPEEVLEPENDVWDVEFIKSWLSNHLQKVDYDFIFTMVPVPETHGHHQAATILALQVFKDLRGRGPRPVIVGARSAHGPVKPAPTGVSAYSLTAMRSDVGPWVFDRTASFGFKNRLNYGIIVNWVIAAHRSQGTMQLAMNRGEREEFFLFDVNDPDAWRKVATLFEALARKQFKSRTYGTSAGTNVR